MSIKKPINPITVGAQATTLESLIEDLDDRGLLVLQVLLGQQAMKILTEAKIKEKTSSLVDRNNNSIKVIS